MSGTTSRPTIYRRNLYVDYVSDRFPSSYAFKRQDRLAVTWEDLLWSALTIGRPNIAYVFAHGEASYFEAAFRISLVRMALHQQPYGFRFVKTDAFKALDPTEKGAVSYFLGMAVCKVFATSLLRTPWLLHLDVFRDQIGAQNVGRSRPDLVGQDPAGKWHAFETKGRSGKPGYEDKIKAKDQAERLKRVDGADCELHVGCFTYFSQNALEFYWRDPEPEDLDPIELRVPKDAWQHYYSPALALARDEGAAKVPGRETFDLAVEIHPEVRLLLEEGSWDKARETARAMEGLLKEESFRPDGIRIRCGESWSASREGT